MEKWTKEIKNDVIVLTSEHLSKKVRIKIGEEDGHDIAEHKKPDQTGTLSLDHRCPL